MNKKIPCEVIQDLLPLYAEDLTQAETGQLIEEHLKNCESCSRIYQNMINKIGKEVIQEDNTISEIDYLKKVRQKNQKKIILSSLITIGILILAAAVKLFVIGSPIGDYSTVITVTDQTAEIKGVINDSFHVYSHYKVKNGEIIVYGRLPSFGNQPGCFTINYDLSEGDVSIGGNRIKADGKVITGKALELYKARNPYIGDMSANNRVSNALGISSDLGKYLNSLQTSKEPYGWTLEFQDEVLGGNQVKFDSTMEAYACVLIALVDNCNEVSWTYTCNHESYASTFSAADAENKIGNDIKSYASSPEKVQELLEVLSIK